MIIQNSRPDGKRVDYLKMICDQVLSSHGCCFDKELKSYEPHEE